MAANVDLYQILVSFANKRRSPTIDVENFVVILEKNARKKASTDPEWAFWIEDTSKKVRAELDELSAQGKIRIIFNEQGTHAVIPLFYEYLVQEAYAAIDETADQPFPDPISLGMDVTPDVVLSLRQESALTDFMTESKIAPDKIIEIEFPDSLQSGLALVGMIPRRLLEASLLKVRNYLQGHSNKDYIQNKLVPQLQGKESQIRALINQILLQPLDCITNMEEAGNFAYLFWVLFCNILKADIKRKKEMLSEDIGTLQSLYMIDAANRYYKDISARYKDKDAALNTLNFLLDRPPYQFNLAAIQKFTDPKGAYLLDQYTEEELVEYLTEQSTVAGGGKMPDLLVFRTQRGEQRFIKKRYVLSLCVNLLTETRPLVRKAVSNHWLKILAAYQKERAMDDDEAFERYLAAKVRESSPDLSMFLDDSKLLLVYGETRASPKDAIVGADKIFQQDKMRPFSDILGIHRKEILNDTRLKLPFWYSIPFLVGIMTFVSRYFSKASKTEKASSRPGRTQDDEAQQATSALSVIEKDLVPGDYTIEEYLTELTDRWARLQNKQDRENLIEDVSSLVRDRLRRLMRIQKRSRITGEILNGIAEQAVNDSSELRKLGDQKSLNLYMQVYMLKQLKDKKI
jgi:hypothetical protein